jgi:peptidyl-prolyl cis-trans isomerase A (cyclophilin A)
MGNDAFGSQFYITTAPAPWLDGEHQIIGHVSSGMDVIARIAAQPVDDRERPTWPVVMDRVRVS